MEENAKRILIVFGSAFRIFKTIFREKPDYEIIYQMNIY